MVDFLNIYVLDAGCVIKSHIGQPITSSQPPPLIPRIIVRQHAPRPLPALFAIVALIGVMLLLSFAMDSASTSEGTPSVAAEVSFDEISR